MGAPGVLRSPQELYEDWEHSHWAARDIDLSRDPGHWAVLPERERELLYWVLSSLMVAEERISTQFCGLVLAQDDEEEGSYLGAHDRLRSDPGNREAKVEFVTVYHMVIEGTLGLTASHFLLDFLRDRELLPGFTDGYGRIAADEQRHIAYGTEFLRRAVRDNPAMESVIRSRILDLLPAVAESVSPPSDGAWDILGVEDGELGQFGLNALTRRLKIVGVSLT
jgi:ribonucleoside-diphosphate reductase beta chain